MALEIIYMELLCPKSVTEHIFQFMVSRLNTCIITNKTPNRAAQLYTALHSVLQSSRHSSVHVYGTCQVDIVKTGSFSNDYRYIPKEKTLFV